MPTDALGHTSNEERHNDLSLQPKRLCEFIGQSTAKENLYVYIAAAIKRREALDHVLLTGPADLGKSTLAHIIANEMGGQLRLKSGQELDKTSDIAVLLTNLQDGDLLFIHKIHLLPQNLVETLYQAIKYFAFDLHIGQGIGARTVNVELPHFTLIATTTLPTLIPARLRTLFGINVHFDFYSVEDLANICMRSANLLSIEIDERAAHEIAQRSRGTPRLVNRLLRRVRDYADVDYEGRIKQSVAEDALNRMEIDTYGLNDNDRRLLLAIIEKFNGGPVGLDSLSSVIDEEKHSIEENIEPYLIRIGFINRTASGRIVTQLAYQHFGMTPGHQGPNLFD
jgi:holliday junction DNA helicase RuvB